MGDRKKGAGCPLAILFLPAVIIAALAGAARDHRRVRSLLGSAALCIIVFFVNLEITHSKDLAFASVLASLALGWVIPFLMRRIS